jgi:SNF2 family DNA or RNA helicase
VPKKKAIVLKVRDVERITTLIPKSKVLKPHVVAVKHGVEEVKVLRNLGFDVPSPIRYYYEWSGTYKPFAAQETTADFLTSHGRAFCLNDLGTGKSLSTLWSYDYMRSIRLAGKLLIVSPLSTLERTWADELFRHFPHLNYAVLHGSREKRLKLLEQDVDVYIINHDGVEIIVDALKNRYDITHIVVDEIAQVARNASTDRWKSLNTVINKQVPRQAWGLTGTPTPNLPTDAWAQCRLLVPEKVPVYFNKFKDMVLRQVGPFTWLPRDNSTEVVKDAMQPSIRFSRDECVDLPPCLYETRQVELTAEQDKAYKQMMSKLAAEVDSGEIIAVNEAVKMSKLLQIACLAYNTDVLTDRGWVPIQNVSSSDLVWDGTEWVSQGGSVYKGFKPVHWVGGVRMTEDHKVWIGEWVEAKEEHGL